MVLSRFPTIPGVLRLISAHIDDDSPQDWREKDRGGQRWDPGSEKDKFWNLRSTSPDLIRAHPIDWWHSREPIQSPNPRNPLLKSGSRRSRLWSRHIGGLPASSTGADSAFSPSGSDLTAGRGSAGGWSRPRSRWSEMSGKPLRIIGNRLRTIAQCPGRPGIAWD